jgi:excisionase family DNA binding protein
MLLRKDFPCNVPTLIRSCRQGQDALRAGEVRGALEGRAALNAPLRVQVDDSTVLDLPPIVARLLMDILEETAAGRAVTLIPVEAEVTTQQAAELLNVSRPFVVGIIDKGVLPSRMVGNQRRLPLKDVLAYKADNRAKRHKILDEMAAIDQELGLI